MKVALVDPSLFTWPYDHALASGLVANGHEVLIYGRKPTLRLPADQEPFLRRHFYRLIEGDWAARLPKKLFLALKGINHIWSMASLIARFRRDRPDIIHFQWAPLPAVDRLMLGQLRKIAPIVLTVHDSAPFNDNPKSRLQALGAIDILRRFDRLIVHTEKAGARVASYGIPADRIRQIPHGLLENAEPLTSAPPPERAEGEVHLLLFGQIKPYKGCDVMLRAVAALPEEARRRCRIDIVGRPQMPMEPIFALVEELGLADQVRFDLRFIAEEEIGDLLRSADILMFPYIEIDASGVLMLALGVGRPMIASNIGLFRELLDDSHGALVPPGDVAALSDAIGRLVNDVGLRGRAGENVFALSRSIPDWIEIGRRTTSLYGELLSQRD